MRITALLITLIISIAPGISHAESSRHKTAVATFAGGCFWCMEKPFDKLDGVLSTTSGYTGGHVENPTYEQVSSGTTGHYEALQVTYNPDKVSYEKLLHVFWHNIDPTDARGQFCDKGQQYTSAAFYHDDEQHQHINASLETLKQNKPFDANIVTRVLPASRFYAAEEYHQDYYLKNPIRYRYYRFSCGRDARLKKLWGETH